MMQHNTPCQSLCSVMFNVVFPFYKCLIFAMIHFFNVQQEARAERQETRLHGKAVRAAAHGNIGRAVALEVRRLVVLYTFTISPTYTYIIACGGSCGEVPSSVLQMRWQETRLVEC